MSSSVLAVTGAEWSFRQPWNQHVQAVVPRQKNDFIPPKTVRGNTIRLNKPIREAQLNST